MIGAAVEISHALLKTGEDLLIICRKNSPKQHSRPCIRRSAVTCDHAGKFMHTYFRDISMAYVTYNVDSMG